MGIVFLPNIKSKEELMDLLFLLYRIKKHSLALPCHSKETEEIVHKNMRMGLSMAGYLSATDEQRSWLDSAYTELRAFDVEYSKKHGWPASIKLTTFKPDGCRPADALVTTYEGIYTLEELDPSEDSAEWTPLDGRSCDGGNVTQFYRNGPSLTYRIKMNFGMEVESTANHQWMVDKKGWTRADEIEEGDVLHLSVGNYTSTWNKPLNPIPSPVYGNATTISFPETVNEDLCWLMGYLWGDGCLSPVKKRIRFIDRNVENLEKAKRVLKDQFNLDANIHPAPNKDASVLEKGSVHLWDWLIVNGFWKYRTDGGLNNIPLTIRESSRDCIVAFLAGWFDADGHYKDGRATFSTSDTAFAKHAQDVGWAVGLAIGRSHNTGGTSHQEKKSMWLLSVSSNTTQDAWNAFDRNSNKVKGPISCNRVFQCGVVRSVEEAGIVDTFDVETTDHWFYAGAVKSHNTCALLPYGITPGIHPGFAEFMIRRIRISSGHPLVQVCKDHGYPVEFQRGFDGLEDRSTVVVEFPFAYPKGTVLAKDLTAIDQLEWVKKGQTEWSDNSVSCTVYYRKEEMDDIKAYLKKNYNKTFKTLSFLLHSEHGFVQAPFEGITEEEYNKRVASSRTITSASTAIDFEADSDCVSGMCPIK